MVRPRLEYANPVWAPYLRKHIDNIESVQRRASKQVPCLKGLSYQERLRKLQLPTLAFRRLRGDMIETFKILTNVYDKEAAPLLELAENNLRGHPLKLYQKRANRLDIRRNFFTLRIVQQWNSLPASIVMAKDTNTFKNQLDRHWKDHPLKFNPDT